MRKGAVLVVAGLVAAAAGAVSLGVVRFRDEPAETTALPAPSPNLMSVADALRSLPKPEQVARAQQAAFGTTGVASVPGPDGGEMRYAPGEILWIGDTAVLLSPGTNAEDCHACSGAVGITYLRPVAGGFAVAGKWLDMIHGNGFGAPPSDWRVATDMAPAPVVVAQTGFSNQGYSCGVTTLTELTPTGPVQSDPVPTSFSNEGAVDPDSGRTMGGAGARDLSGEIVDVRRGQGFAVRAGSITERYVRRGDRFVRDGGPSALDCGGGA